MLWIAIPQLIMTVVGTAFISSGLQLNWSATAGVFMLAWALMPVVKP